MWSLIAGLIIGLLCFIPASHGYRFWKDSAPLREERDYARASVADIESDWRLYQHLSQRYAYLGRFSEMPRIAESMRARLSASGNDTLDTFRNGSDPAIDRTAWEHARVSYKHALDLQPSSAELKGKVAVADGYLELERNPTSPQPAQQRFQQAAALLPKSPDPHLGLARIYSSALHNPGLAMAEFHAAERLGYKLGPREFEQQADGYLYRAEQELRQWQHAATPAEQHKYLSLMQRDFDRARTLYEPIAGFSNVSRGLERLEADESAAERMQASRERARLAAVAAAHRKARYRRWP
jgi:hypothetical protein